MSSNGPLRPQRWQAVSGVVLVMTLTAAAVVISVMGRANTASSIIVLLGFPTTVAYMVVLMVLSEQPERTVHGWRHLVGESVCLF